MEDSADDREVLDQLTMLADELLQQAGEIRRQWTELAEVLGAEVPEVPPEAPLEPAAGPGAAAAHAQTAVDTGEDTDPIRLVALDMMLSGRTRDEVRSYLEQTFGDADREAVLDEIFTRYG
jgi:hypothetical protein